MPTSITSSYMRAYSMILYTSYCCTCRIYCDTWNKTRTQHATRGPFMKRALSPSGLPHSSTRNNHMITSHKTNRREERAHQSLPCCPMDRHGLLSIHTTYIVVLAAYERAPVRVHFFRVTTKKQKKNGRPQVQADLITDRAWPPPRWLEANDFQNPRAPLLLRYYYCY